MSSTTNLTLKKSGYVKSNSAGAVFTTNTSTWYQLREDNPYYYMFFGFNAMPSNLRHKKILSARLRAQVKSTTSNSYYNSTFDADALTSDFDANTLTYNNQPKTDRWMCTIKVTGAFSGDAWSDTSVNAYAATLAIRNGLRIENYSSESYIKTALSGGGQPYLEVTYDESVSATSQIVYQSGPKSGYKNPRTATTFQWAFEVDSSFNGYCADDSFSQASAIFHWKKSTDNSYTDVSISGSTESVTIAANTFPAASTIEWYVTGTDEDGTTTSTPVYSFSTAAGTVSANVISPNRSVEDGSAPITLRWNVTSTDGQAASRTRVDWRKASDEDVSGNWHLVTDVNQSITSVIVAGGTFPAGEIVWRVRVWNIDSTEGTSSSATFISVAAPDPVSGLSATPVPLTTISWQSADQQAYEIRIDGEVVQKAFGPSIYNWGPEEPLSEGTHVITVSVQGEYGFWSDPSEITITVSGPRSRGTITGEFGVDAVLTHSLHSDKEIRWYRDGVFIGTSHGSTEAGAVFVDRRVTGEHSYFARYWWNNGEDYDQSNILTGTMGDRKTRISALDGSTGWLDIHLSENSDNQEQFRWSRDAVTQHVTGASWPQLERSTFLTASGRYSCAFADQDSVRVLEALYGQIVIVKSRGDNVVIGMLKNITKTVKRFYTAFSFEIEQIYTEDFSAQ